MPELPFALFSWWIYMPVTIAGKETFAHLDTGAQQCRVTKTFAQGLKVIGEREALGVHGKYKVEMVEIEQLTFFGKQFRNLPASVIDHEDMFSALPFQVDIVLSGDVILAEPIVFDFRMQTMNKRANSLDRLTTRPLKTSNGLPFFSLRGSKELNAVFDLGASNTVINQECLKDFPAAARLYDVPVPDTLGGNQVLTFFDIGKVKFNDYELKLEALSANLSGLSSAVGRKVDLIFGVNSMMQGRWFLDKAGEMIGFTPH